MVKNIDLFQTESQVSSLSGPLEDQTWALVHWVYAARECEDKT